jgi:hypothetical protein
VVDAIPRRWFVVMSRFSLAIKENGKMELSQKENSILQILLDFFDFSETPLFWT